MDLKQGDIYARCDVIPVNARHSNAARENENRQAMNMLESDEQAHVPRGGATLHPEAAAISAAVRTEPGTGDDGAIPASGSRVRRLIDWVAAHPRLPLYAALTVAVFMRLFLVVRSHAMIDGDEALLGIQAEHILQGQFPTYYYSQVYMGSLEAYLVAALFAIVGPSTWALRAIPLILSLLLVYLTWRLAYRLLPPALSTTTLLAGVAALFAAAPPLYDAVVELRAWGGQIEIYVISLALLLVTADLGDRLRDGAMMRALTLRWGVWGALAGLGIWINPLVVYALATSVLWLALPWLRRVWDQRQAIRLSPRPSLQSFTRALVPAAALLVGLGMGGLPAWLYAAQHNAENLLVYVSQPAVDVNATGAMRYGRAFLALAITTRYATCIGPRVLDGQLPHESLIELPLRLILLLIPLASIVCGLWVLRRRTATAEHRRPELPLLYAGVITAVFCLGTSAWAAVKPCSFDWATRYAVPLVLVEPLLLLGLFAAPRVLQALKDRRLRVGNQVDLRSDARQARLRRGWVVVLVVVVLGGMLQGSTYALANASDLFQSPFYTHVPADTSQLLEYLSAHEIHDAWANHWLGNVVTFQTDGATVCADYYDQVARGGIHRPPGTLEAVMRAQRPSFIVMTDQPHPLLAQQLDVQGIPYTLAVLARSNVVVITPARTVDPATVVDGLGQDYVSQ